MKTFSPHCHSERSVDKCGRLLDSELSYLLHNVQYTILNWLETQKYKFLSQLRYTVAYCWGFSESRATRNSDSDAKQKTTTKSRKILCNRFCPDRYCVSDCWDVIMIQSAATLCSSSAECWDPLWLKPGGNRDASLLPRSSHFNYSCYLQNFYFSRMDGRPVQSQPTRPYFAMVRCVFQSQHVCHSQLFK